MNFESYKMNMENQCINVCSPCSHPCYDIFKESKEKDVIISQLKAHIFELELREKNYNILNERYNQLQNDLVQLNDCKLQLECEKKLRDDKYNKNIYHLQGENENLQISFNEKLSTNKDIFSENNCLGKEIELKDIQICELKAKLNDLTNQLNKNSIDRENLRKIAQGLTDIKASQNIKLSQLLEDNKSLKGICSEQDYCLKASSQEILNLGQQYESKNKDIQNLNCDILQKANNQNALQNELSKMNVINSQFQNNIKGQENLSNDLKCENDDLNNTLIKEKSIRIGEEQKNNQLTNIFNDRDKKVDILNRDIDSIKRLQQNVSNRNCVLQNENEKLRKHILVLTDLNQTLVNEIDNVINEDQKMKCILNRKERINSVLVNNRCTIDQSLNNLDECVNIEKCCNCMSTCRHIYDCY